MIQVKFLSACRENNLKIVKEILENEEIRIKIDECGNDQRTALYWAVVNNSLDLVRMLVERGSDIIDIPSLSIVRDESSRNQFFRFLEPPLVTASRINNSTIAEYLIFQGCLVDKKSILLRDARFESLGGPDLKSGITAVHYAAYHHNTSLIKQLIDHGAKINAVDYDGNTPLHMAALCKYGDSKCVQQSETIDLLCRYQSDPLVNNRRSCSALLISAMYGCLSSVELLLKSLVISKTVNSYSPRGQNSPLHVASFKGRHDILKILIKAGLKLDPLGLKQLTPLQINITNHSSSPVALTLIYHGCDVNCYQRPPNFPSLMTIALRNPRFDCESLAYVLLKVGYDLNQDVWLISDDGLDGGFLFRDNFFRQKRIETSLVVPPFHVPNGRLKSLQRWLQDQLRKPRMLSDLCRITIRRILYNVVGNISIKESIQKLKLPHILESFVHLHNFLELTDDDLIKVSFKIL